MITNYSSERTRDTRVAGVGQRYLSSIPWRSTFIIVEDSTTCVDPKRMCGALLECWEEEDCCYEVPSNCFRIYGPRTMMMVFNSSGRLSTPIRSPTPSGQQIAKCPLTKQAKIPTRRCHKIFGYCQGYWTRTLSVQNGGPFVAFFDERRMGAVHPTNV